MNASPPPLRVVSSEDLPEIAVLGEQPTCPSNENSAEPECTSVDAFLRSIPDPALRADCLELADLMRTITGREPIMWGPSIVGFGRLDRSENQHCLCDGLEVGFAPRIEPALRCARNYMSPEEAAAKIGVKTRIVLYLRRYSSYYADYIAQMGQVRAGRATISIGSLAEVDRGVLEDLIRCAWEDCTLGYE